MQNQEKLKFGGDDRTKSQGFANKVSNDIIGFGLNSSKN